MPPARDSLSTPADLENLTSAAAHTRVPRTHLVELVRNGRLGHWRIGGRIYLSRAEVVAFIAAGRVEAGER
jgi:excisionase family DNA binding protein